MRDKQFTQEMITQDMEYEEKLLEHNNIADSFFGFMVSNSTTFILTITTYNTTNLTNKHIIKL